jgi:sigma-E factor negative regulatory protein RseA
MRQEIGEALSALADGEATELDLRRVLRAVDDPEVLESWARWHRHADALRGLYTAHAGDTSEFLRQVRNGIAKTQEQSDAQLESPGSIRAAARDSVERELQRWWSKPFGGLAVAASVAAAALWVGQNLPLDSVADAESVVRLAEGAGFSLPAFPVSGGNTVPVGSSLTGSSAPSAHVYQDLARERLNLYRSLHAEQAAMTGREGLVPYVRAGALADEPEPASIAEETPPPASPSPAR